MQVQGARWPPSKTSHSTMALHGPRDCHEKQETEEIVCQSRWKSRCTKNLGKALRELGNMEMIPFLDCYLGQRCCSHRPTPIPRFTHEDHVHLHVEITAVGTVSSECRELLNKVACQPSTLCVYPSTAAQFALFFRIHSRFSNNFSHLVASSFFMASSMSFNS